MTLWQVQLGQPAAVIETPVRLAALHRPAATEQWQGLHCRCTPASSEQKLTAVSGRRGKASISARREAAARAHIPQDTGSRVRRLSVNALPSLAALCGPSHGCCTAHVAGDCAHLSGCTLCKQVTISMRMNVWHMTLACTGQSHPVARCVARGVSIRCLLQTAQNAALAVHPMHRRLHRTQSG